MIKMEQTSFFLTEFSKAAGCGCKIAPAVLQEILTTDQVTKPDPHLLVGYQTNDDAAVYDLGNGECIISTTDFFAPVVDDAFDFGCIAAANAISDVYAMGGTPFLALAILGWPVEQLPPSLAKKVLEGARSVCAEAGIPLAGGHSIDAREPFFGLTVSGRASTSSIKRNNTAKEGDLLLLTKPLGVGILTTAEKRKVLQEEHKGEAVKQMTILNKVGQKLSSLSGVHAMTDVTGFGLLGHLIEMAGASALTAQIEYAQLPVLEAARYYLSQRIIPDATYRNWNYYQSKTRFAPGVNVMEAFQVLPDPQTNGGLLIAADPDSLTEIQKILKAEGLSSFTDPIGKMVSKEDVTVVVI